MDRATRNQATPEPVVRLSRRLLRSAALLLPLSALALWPCTGLAIDVQLAWEPSPSPDVAGYRLFLRERGQGYDYTQPAWEGQETSCTLYNLDDDKDYYFVVRAFDLYNNESPDSNEVELPFVLVHPPSGSVQYDPPVFQWTPGPYDVYLFLSVFSYPGVGYHVAMVWLREDFLEMPPSWWVEVGPGNPNYWAVLGINTTTWEWEFTEAWAFLKADYPQ